MVDLAELAELANRMRQLVDDQEGGDAVVLVQRQLFNRIVGRIVQAATLIETQAARIAELEAAQLDREVSAGWLREWARKKFGPWITYRTALTAINDLQARLDAARALNGGE